MPHIIVNCFKGRSDEVKQKVAESLKAAIIESMGVGPERVSVAFHEVDKEGGEKHIYHDIIMAKKEELVIHPGYTPKE